jgi:hypothetical protein
MAQMRGWLRLTLVGTTVVGGLLGIAVTLRAFFRSEPGFGTFALLGCALLGFVYITAAGVLYWRNPRQVQPLTWALAIQVPWISLPGFVYKFAAGAVGSIALVATKEGDTLSAGLHTYWHAGSSFELRFLQDAQWELGVNAAALLLLVLLQRSIHLTADAVEAQSSTADAKAPVLQIDPDQTLRSRDDE